MSESLVVYSLYLVGSWSDVAPVANANPVYTKVSPEGSKLSLDVFLYIETS